MTVKTSRAIIRFCLLYQSDNIRCLLRVNVMFVSCGKAHDFFNGFNYLAYDRASAITCIKLTTGQRPSVSTLGYINHSLSPPPRSSPPHGTPYVSRFQSS